MENRNIRYQLDRLPIVLILACLVVSVVADNINREGESTRLVKLGENFAIKCLSSNNTAIVWRKDGKDVKELNDHKHPKKFDVKHSEGVLVIEKFTEKDVGKYTCTLGPGSGKQDEFMLFAEVEVKMPAALFAVEGEKLEIVCIIYGSEQGIQWEYRNESFEAVEVKDDGATTIVTTTHSSGYVTTKLLKNQTSIDDKGYYKCKARNEKDESREAEGLLHVKDKLAALWPFLGICAEVFILCAIILIYESRRNKTEQEDSDTDQPEQKYRK